MFDLMHLTTLVKLFSLKNDTMDAGFFAVDV